MQPFLFFVMFSFSEYLEVPSWTTCGGLLSNLHPELAMIVTILESVWVGF